MAGGNVMDLWKQAWCEHGFGKPITEFRFHPVRKFRFDFAWPRHKVAVEIDGYGFGHQAIKGMAGDNEKINLAIECGWLVLRYTSRQLGSRDKRRAVVQQVLRVLESRKPWEAKTEICP
jgi:very-short-patch-repair endonuclease